MFHTTHIWRLAAAVGLGFVLLTTLGSAPFESGAPDIARTEQDGRTTATGDSLSPQVFAELRAYIEPDADEMKWRQLNWRTSFWQAVVDAHREKKPVLLWAMNGHPMGCT